MCTPNASVARVITGREAHVHIRAGARNFITEKLANSAHLINHYPDLYWMVVFGHFDRQVIYDNDDRQVHLDIGSLATLLDNHGLVPDTDHHDVDEANYRHVPRPRVHTAINSLYEIYLQNQPFYESFRFEQRRVAAGRAAVGPFEYPVEFDFDVTVPIEAVARVVPRGTYDRNYVLARNECHHNIVNAANEISVAFVTLLDIQVEQIHLFTLWLEYVLHQIGPNPIRIPGTREPQEGDDDQNYFNGRRVQRFRLGFALTVYDQFCFEIDQVKGKAYDLDEVVTQQIRDEMRLLNTNLQERMQYMAALVRLLAHCGPFVQQYGQEGEFRLEFVEYLVHIGVSHQGWDWPTAIEMAIRAPLVPGEIAINFAPDQEQWDFLQTISIMPSRRYVNSRHFMGAFVDSMIEYEKYFQSRVQGRIDHEVRLQDSVRLRRENPRVHPRDRRRAPIDPFAVRAKVVWLLFVVPYLQQYVDYFRVDGGRGPNGFNVRQGHGGGQGQMPPPPPNQPNNEPDDYDPTDYFEMDYRRWDLKTVPQTKTQDCAPTSGSSSSNMNGEIDGSEAKNQEDDPNEQILNDLNDSFSALHLSTTV